MQTECFCLNSEYATTRRVTRTEPGSEADSALFIPANRERRGKGGLRTKGYFKRSLPEKPLVSVITVVLNGERYLEQTIKSVLEQDYDNVEYIVIDGGSTDGTLDIIREYEHAIDYWVSEPDLGISDAFNKGITASTGKWLNFMNCGDRFASPQAIQCFVDHIDEAADVIFGRANVVDSKGEMLLKAGRPFDRKKFARGRMIPHQSAFHNRRYFQQYGLFDKRLRVQMVYEFLMRKMALSTVFIDETLSSMLAGGVHESEDYLRLREARMIKKKYCSGVHSAIIIEFDYCHALVRALVKRALNRIGLRRVTLKVRQLESKFR